MFKKLKETLKSKPNLFAIQCFDPFFWDFAKNSWFPSENKTIINSKDEFFKQAGSRGLFASNKFLQANFHSFNKKDLQEILKVSPQKGCRVLIRLNDKIKDFEKYDFWVLKKPSKFKDRMDLIKEVFKHFDLNLARSVDRYLWDIGCQAPCQMANLAQMWQLSFAGQKTLTVQGIESIYYGSKERKIFFDLAKELKKYPNYRNINILKKFIDQGENVLGLLGFIFSDIFKGELYAVSSKELLNMENQIKRGADPEKLLCSLFLVS